MLILGLDNAGKTTILCACNGYFGWGPLNNEEKSLELPVPPINLLTTSNPLTLPFATPNSCTLPLSDRLQVDEPVTTVPTIGFNVETLRYKNIKFQVWDLGGQTSIRPYWRCYYPNTDAIIFVVDSTDVERLELAKAELFALLDVR